MCRFFSALCERNGDIFDEEARRKSDLFKGVDTLSATGSLGNGWTGEAALENSERFLLESQKTKKTESH